jgi:outer membrane receptor protein involved in Fe transport
MASYEYSDENACPYYFVDTLSNPAPEKEGLGEITQNRQSRYRRSLWNTSLGVEWIAPKFVLTQIAAYQHLSDRLFMDQDFIAKDIFSLTQKQRVGNFTEEISLRSSGRRFWEWTAGAFFRYQHTQTDCPVVFHGDGMRFLNNQFAAVLPKNPPMSLAFTNDELRFVSDIKTPMLSGALFHQSTLNFGAGISAVAGIRLAYDHHTLDLRSGLASPATYQFAMPAFRISANLSSSPEVNGTLKKDTWQVLPKVALQYKHKSGRGNVYLSAAKGYRPGGYNLQSYSDLAQVSLRRDMMLGVKEFSINTINAMPLTDAAKQGAIAAMSKALDPNIPAEPNIADLEYKAEEAWNYELGGHLNFNLGQGTLGVDYSAFYVTTKNRQLARFAESGMGRVTVNAGRSRSIGAEVALRAEPLLDRLILQATYGYTHATLVEHNLGEQNGVVIDYSGNRVPFAPEHTFSANATYRQPLHTRVLRAVHVGLGTYGAGRIYWDEANTFEQPFYAQLQARVGVEFPADVKFEIIGHNLTNTRFTTFAFDSMERRFAQYSNPFHLEMKLGWHF